MNNNLSDAFSYAAKICSVAEHCRQEVMEKIRRFELSPEEVQELFERLENDGFIDERRFAKAYVNDKFLLNKWGRAKIQSYLKQKALPTDVIQEALSQVDEARYCKTLLDLMRRKDRSISNAGNFERRAKLYRFALGRGFEVPLVNRCLNDYLHENHESDE